MDSKTISGATSGAGHDFGSCELLQIVDAPNLSVGEPKRVICAVGRAADGSSLILQDPLNLSACWRWPATAEQVWRAGTNTFMLKGGPSTAVEGKDVSPGPPCYVLRCVSAEQADAIQGALFTTAGKSKDERQAVQQAVQPAVQAVQRHTSHVVEPPESGTEVGTRFRERCSNANNDANNGNTNNNHTTNNNNNNGAPSGTLRSAAKVSRSGGREDDSVLSPREGDAGRGAGGGPDDGGPQGGRSQDETHVARTARQNSFDRKTDKGSSDMYFHYYGMLMHQQNMLQDFTRTGTYYMAILENRVDFEGKVVMDVGAGSGILSLFAAQAGARKVYAVEASGMAKYARQLADGNPAVASRIEVVCGKVEEISVPEKVDVLVSEPMGTLLVNERMLETYLYARNHFLKPGGKMFPGLGRIHAALFQDQVLYAELLGKAAFWTQSNFYGVNITPLYTASLEGFFGQVVVDAFEQSVLQSDCATRIIDFSTANEKELCDIELPLSLTVGNAPCTIHGLACWFDVLFNGSIHPTWLSTAPGLPTTHWFQLRCVLQQPLIIVAPRTVVTGSLRLVAHARQSYDVHVTLEAPPLHPGMPPQKASGKYDLKEPYYRQLTTAWQQAAVVATGQAATAAATAGATATAPLLSVVSTGADNGNAAAGGVLVAAAAAAGGTQVPVDGLFGGTQMLVGGTPATSYLGALLAGSLGASATLGQPSGAASSGGARPEVGVEVLATDSEPPVGLVAAVSQAFGGQQGGAAAQVVGLPLQSVQWGQLLLQSQQQQQPQAAVAARPGGATSEGLVQDMQEP